jgi:hypothetical protein
MKERKGFPKGFIVVTKYEGTSEPSMSFRTDYDEAVDLVHEYFLGYDFEVKDGKAYDPGHESGRPGDTEPFDCFDNVEFHNGKVIQFWHCNGDGPEAWIEENE